MNKKALELASEFGHYTNPERYGRHYKNLPQSFDELCDLIKKQFIHPVDVGKFKLRLSPAKRREQHQIRNVRQIITKLMIYNPKGITLLRNPKERLILQCDHHALFFASMLKYLGRPTRVRVGFARYLSLHKKKYVSHWICETWLEEEQRWMYIDPDRKIVDVPKDEFKLGAGAWRDLRDKISPPSMYYYKRWRGLSLAKINLLCDFNSIMNNEFLHRSWDDDKGEVGPDLFSRPISKLRVKEKKFLDHLAELLINPDENMDELSRLYNGFLNRQE